MHFNIWKGKGIPILFESGGGNDGSIWSSLATDIHTITGTTVITYDRVGYGRSEFNPALADNKKALITHGIEALVGGLQELGYFDELILVAHSYGGNYATYLAAKYPVKIKGMVLIDVVLSCIYTKEYMAELEEERTTEWLNNIRSISIPAYNECLSFFETIDIMRDITIPLDISVIDLVADNPPYEDEENSKKWKRCHMEFADASPNRTGIIAYNCDHYLHFDNKKLAVDAIIKIFCAANLESDNQEILSRYSDYSMESSNTYRQREYAYWHSEGETNNWGYALLGEKNIEAALKTFELNTILYPESSNVWDSYGEALLLYGEKEKAKKMYQKALELNPKSKSAKAALKNMEE